MTYAAKKIEVLAALKPVRSELRALGISLHPKKYYRDFLTLSVGCDPELAEDVRVARWAAACPVILGALEAAGLCVLRDKWPFDGRTFAVAY